MTPMKLVKAHYYVNLLQNISCVLKSGGRLCAINEPSISVAEQEQAMLQQYAAEELALGINETRPSFLQYFAALNDNDLLSAKAFSPFTYGLSTADLLIIGKELGAIWGGFSF